jgi:DNA-binding MarR family transcriptional regulator
MTSVKRTYADTLDVDDFEPKHLGYLLGRATQRMRHDLNEAAVSLGLGAKYKPLTGSYFRFVSLIPEGGARVTDLARVNGMTKQALGQYADLLEERGYIVSSRLESDRRVRLLSRTPRGEEMVADVNRLYRELDRRWKREVGAARWDEFRGVLMELAVGWEAEV